MNPTSHDAQTRHPEAEPGADQSFCADELPELIEIVDPTEDLANDVTSELPGPGMHLRLVPQRVIDPDVVVANDDPVVTTPVMTAGAVLRDRYILEQPVGYGGSSVVLRARDMRRAGATDPRAVVAVKLLRPEFRDRPECIARLRREFHQTQSVAHPNVVRFYDLDCDRGTWFIAMELLVGEPLGRRLRQESPPGLPAGEALRIAAACGEALACAHDHGVMHGDVKPDNVFLTASGEVRLLDFGVAPDSVHRSIPGHCAIADPVVGVATRAYASPEVLSGQPPEPRDDVFSLACMIYEMLVGRHPYGRRGADDASEAGLEIERLPGLSVRQWRALAAGLAWKREGRPEVRELLRALVSNGLAEPAPAPLLAETVAAPPVRIVEGQLLRRPGRQWRGPAVIGIAIVLGVLIGRFAFDSPGESRAGPGSTPPVTVESTTGLSPSGNSLAVIDAAAPAGFPPEIWQVAAAPEAEAGVSQPLAPGLVAFESGTMTVSKRAIVAPVPVRHFGTRRRNVTVGWRVLDGTAVAGRDYGGPQSGIARFSEGHTFRMIYVPILADADATADRSFTVELTDASPGASLGMTERIVVTILDDV